MTAHHTPEELELAAAGELAEDAHLRDCRTCTAALLETLRMKRAVREAMPRFAPPARLASLVIPTEREGPGGRGGAREEPLGAARPPRSLATLGMTGRGWLGVAAVLVVAILGIGVWRGRDAAARELADLHSTIVASANPIDVLSTDRHTVKPWFEGRVPFAVDVAELRDTPFRLVGGRVVFWRGRVGAYLLVIKGAHRISLFAFEEDDVPMLGTTARQSIETWSRGGLRWIAVGDVPPNDLAALRAAWTR